MVCKKCSETKKKKIMRDNIFWIVMYVIYLIGFLIGIVIDNVIITVAGGVMILFSQNVLIQLKREEKENGNAR